jgi:hypothetical protein
MSVHPPSHPVNAEILELPRLVDFGQWLRKREHSGFHVLYAPVDGFGGLVGGPSQNVIRRFLRLRCDRNNPLGIVLASLNPRRNLRG